MDDKNKNFSFDEKEIADQVADEILTVEEESYNRHYFFLLLLFFVCLIFLVSSVSFSVFDTYLNGFNNNAIDVGVDVNPDIICTKNCDTDGDGTCDKNCSDDKKDKDKNKDKEKDKADIEGVVITDDNTSDDNDKPGEEETPEIIEPGTVLFSFNEKTNYISMKDVLPTSDSVGKTLSGDKEYFDFNVSVAFKNNFKKNITYEVVLLPVEGNTISGDNIRTYLTEGGSGVSVLSNKVNNFSDLPNSSITQNGKIIYKKNLSSDYFGSYVFRMWLSSSSNVGENKKFGCKVVVNAYYAD